MRYLDRVTTYFSTYRPSPLDESQYLDLAMRIAERVEQIESRLRESALKPGMSYLDRLGTIQTVRAQAEEVALAELLYSIPVPDNENEGERQSPTGLLSDERAIDHRLTLADDSPEAARWTLEHPHLVARMKWIMADHSADTPEQRSTEMTAILDQESRLQGD